MGKDRFKSTGVCFEVHSIILIEAMFLLLYEATCMFTSTAKPCLCHMKTWPLVHADASD